MKNDDHLRYCGLFETACRSAVLCGVALLLLVPAAQAARLALVIGNAAYAHAAQLRNTLNDARDVASDLRTLGFEVKVLENSTLDQLIDAVDHFVTDLHEKGGTGLLFYSGHGVQVGGRNYLVPVDARLERQSRVKYEAYALDDALARMGGRGAGSINLVVLDACRDNPFGATKSVGSKGLARVTAPESTLILYAARPGQTASDNPGGRNGLFTQHFRSAIKRPGVDVEAAFRDVVNGVYRDSGRQQYPWKEGVLLQGFAFLDRPGQINKPVVPTDRQAEDGLWRQMSACATAACYEAYKRAYPKGRYVAAADALIASLGAAAMPPQEPAASAAPMQNHTPLQSKLKRCEVHLASNRLTSGVGGTAWDCYREVLAQDPGNAEAQAGLNRIVEKYVTWGRSALDRGEIAKAKSYLEKATAVQAESPEVAALGEAIAAREAAGREQAEVQRRPQSSGLAGELVEIPGGCFQMGSPGSEEGRDDDERQHRICVEGFWMGRYEVTQKQWRAVMGSNPSHFKNCDNCPVEGVSWYEVQAFLDGLNARTGGGYRLPTEAEWEYACRGGRTGERYCGGNSLDAVAWYDDNAGNKAHPVGRKRSNGFGLYDMSGNAWEWTCSEYDEGYGGGEQRCIGKNEANGRQLVYRGGSWIYGPRFVRSAFRFRLTPVGLISNLGFRLAQD